MQLDGATMSAGGSPSHAVERPEHRAIHQGQRLDGLPHTRVAKFPSPFGLAGQGPQDAHQDFRVKNVLGFREGGLGHGPGADLAHLFKPAAGMAQGPHGFERRIEEAEQQQRKVIFGQHFPARVLLAGRPGRRFQVGPQLLPKPLQQFPVMQLAFLEFRRRRCHAPSKAYRGSLYKLHSCDRPTANRLRPALCEEALFLPNTTGYFPIFLIVFRP